MTDEPLPLGDPLYFDPENFARIHLLQSDVVAAVERFVGQSEILSRKAEKSHV